MLDATINEAVHLTVATGSWELERSLASLPYRARLAIRRALEAAREAYRFERARHCAWYLQRQGARVVIWRWNGVVSGCEASRLRPLIESFAGRLDGQRASRVFEAATGRPVSAGSRGTPSSPARRAAC